MSVHRIQLLKNHYLISFAFLEAFKRNLQSLCFNKRKLLIPHSSNKHNSARQIMNCCEVVKVIEKKIPLNLSEEWDNTGLLIDPPGCKIVSTILFTNDLTEPVLQEAIENKSNFIVTYHPLIFSPIKFLRRTSWKDNIIMKCIQENIAVYSPHTAGDAVRKGVNDWLIECFSLKNVQPIKQSYVPHWYSMIEFVVSADTDVLGTLRQRGDTKIDIIRTEDGKLLVKGRFEVYLENEIMTLLSKREDVSYIYLMPPSKEILVECGMGRIGVLEKELTLRECIQQVKKYLKLNKIRFAVAKSHTLDTIVHIVAGCAGSGASVLKGVKADLYITGEMSHHELLDANHQNVSVILCEHSNSERGYLKKLMEILQADLPGVKLIQSSTDKDPITIE